MFKPRDPERFEWLRSLSPLEAAQAWCEGEFGIGDEPALIEAIRRDPSITMTDGAIIDVMMDAIEEDLDPSACLERLRMKRS